MEINKRLQQFRKSLKLIQADMARILGVGDKTYWNYENTDTNINSDVLIKLVNKYSLNPHWLLTGEGNMFRDHIDDLRHNQAFFVPELGDPVSAGKGCQVFYENINSFYSFPKQYIANELLASPEDVFIMRVMGDSMEPAINDNDLIMIDKSSKSLRDGKIFVVLIDDELLVKRATRLDEKNFNLTSDNKMFYNPITISAQTKLTVLGRVIWKGEKLS